MNWSCDKCTYSNVSEKQKCEICETDKPKPQSGEKKENVAAVGLSKLQKPVVTYESRMLNDAQLIFNPYNDKDGKKKERINNFFTGINPIKSMQIRALLNKKENLLGINELNLALLDDDSLKKIKEDILKLQNKKDIDTIFQNIATQIYEKIEVYKVQDTLNREKKLGMKYLKYKLKYLNLKKSLGL